MADQYIRYPNPNASNSFVLYGSTSGALTLTVPAVVTSYTLTFPAAQGGASTFLQNNGSGVLSWVSTPTALTLGAFDAQAATANGLALVANVLSAQSADATHPGMVNITTQTFAGNKTFTGVVSAPGGSAPAVGFHLSTDVGTGFYRPGVDQLNIAAAGALVVNIGTSGVVVTGNISATNLSGTNTGDVTIGTANGLSLTGITQELNLGLSSTSTTGALSSTDWNTFNGKQSSITIGALDAQAANATGAALVSNVLSLQSATASSPGLVNNTAQTFSGFKAFSSSTGVTPAFAVEVVSDASAGSLAETTYSPTASTGGNVLVRRARGTLASPTAVQLDDLIGTIGGRGYGATAFASATRGNMRFYAAENWTDAAQGTYLSFRTTPIGGLLTAEMLRIADNGVATFTSSVSASNLSGTNTGDVTLGTANGLSFTGVSQVLNLALSSTGTTGALSSTDWNTFNGKQAAGSYITALTGDGAASGPGSATLTLATVNSNVGSFGSATASGTFTVNAKGLITAASSTAIQITESQVTGLTSDLALKAPAASPAFTGTVTASGYTGLGTAVSTYGLTTLSITPQANFTATGTTTVNASTTVSGSGTAFLTELSVGDRVAMSSSAATFAYVTAIASNTSMTIAPALGDGTSQTIAVRKAPLRVDSTSAAGTGLTLSDTGIHLIGYPAAQDVNMTAAANEQIQVRGTAGRLGLYSYTNNGNSGIIRFRKSRSATIGTGSTVTTGDTIGSMTFDAVGTDNAAYSISSSIVATCEGTIGSAIVPGVLKFNTANASGVATAAITIDSAQKVTVSGNLASTAAVITNSYDTASPATAGTVTASANKPGVLITPAATIATCTIKLPSSPIDGQQYWVASSQIITTVTWQDSGGTAGNVIGGPTTIGGTGRGARFVYGSGASIWYNIG